MILDASGRSLVQFHPLAFELAMKPLHDWGADRRVWALRQSLFDLGIEVPEKVGDTIRVRLPMRYQQP